jgi:hypothetical protein
LPLQRNDLLAQLSVFSRQRINALCLDYDLHADLSNPRLEIGQSTRQGGGGQALHFISVMLGVPSPQLLLFLRGERFAARRPDVQPLPDFVRDHTCLQKSLAGESSRYSKGRAVFPQSYPATNSREALRSSP